MALLLNIGIDCGVARLSTTGYDNRNGFCSLWPRLQNWLKRLAINPHQNCTGDGGDCGAPRLASQQGHLTNYVAGLQASKHGGLAFAMLNCGLQHAFEYNEQAVACSSLLQQFGAGV